MYNAEHCVSLSTILDGFIDDIVRVRNFESACLLEVSHSGFGSPEVYLRETLIKQDFSRIELKL